MSDATSTSSAAHADATRDAPRRLRVAFCWTHISGYMAACWRAMNRAPDLEPHVIALASGNRADTFDSAIMGDVPCHFVDKAANSAAIAALVRQCAPDVLVVSGWAHAPYRQMVAHGEIARVPTVMAMDTPWRGDWRQRFARCCLHRYLRRIDRVMVTGERCWQYARQLGFGERQIHRGVYGIDYDALAPVHEQRRDAGEGWPRRFLFVGRYEREKGVDVLLEAYRRYRAAHRSPFELTCCGSGSLVAQVRAAEGVTDRGFVQPAELTTAFAEHGAFVIASRYDPWPLVIVEACAAGLPVVCTSACGSAVEVVRDDGNGWLVPNGNPASLAAALARVHQRAEQPGALAAMGERGRALAAMYSSELWVERWRRLLAEMTEKSNHGPVLADGVGER